MSLGKANTDRRSAVLALAGLTAATACGLWYNDLLGASVESLIDDVRSTEPNPDVAAKVFENYYEKLLQEEVVEDTRIRARLITQGGGTQKEVIQFSGACRYTDDFLPWEFVPHASVIFKGAPLVINEWGQRDRSGYTEEKPDGTFRIAVVGGSSSMGSGVPEPLTFANLIEERLNRELAGRGYDRYEVINFSVGGCYFAERVFMIQRKVGEFEPDLILGALLDKDINMQHTRLARKLKQSKPIPYRFLLRIIKDADVNPLEDTKARMERKLKPFLAEIFRGCLDELYRYRRQRDVEIAFYMLGLTATRTHKDIVRMLEIVGEGPLTVFPIFKPWEVEDPMGEMWLVPHTDPEIADIHPNVEGHRRIADDLYEQLLADPTIGQMLRGP